MENNHTQRQNAHKAAIGFGRGEQHSPPANGWLVPDHEQQQEIMNSKTFRTDKTFSNAALTFLAAASLAFNARADITTGLVGYWSLSDGPGSATVTDLSGNGNTGTLMNYADATYNNMWTAAGDPYGWVAVCSNLH